MTLFRGIGNNGFFFFKTQKYVLYFCFKWWCTSVVQFDIIKMPSIILKRVTAVETTVFSRKIHWLSTIFFWRPLKYSPLVIYQDTNKRLSLFIDNSCTNNLSCDRMFIVLLKIKAKYIQKPNRYISNTISTEPQYGVNFSLFLTLNIVFFLSRWCLSYR